MKGRKEPAKGRDDYSYSVPDNVKDEFIPVFSEMPWEKYIDRMNFTGKIKKGSQVSNRSITIEAKELRIAEVIKEAYPGFQTISDVLRDALSKGLKIDYEILVRRKKKIKLRAEATYNELAFIDEEMTIISHVDMVSERVETILRESKKNVAGRDEDWGQNTIRKLVSTLENDFPSKGIKEHFDRLLNQPINNDVILLNFAQSKKANK